MYERSILEPSVRHFPARMEFSPPTTTGSTACPTTSQLRAVPKTGFGYENRMSGKRLPAGRLLLSLITHWGTSTLSRIGGLS